MLRNILIVFVTLTIMLIAINHYVFSWTGLILSRIGLCEYKIIGVPTWNGLDKRLSYVVDLPHVASVLSSNPNDKVAYHNDALEVSRNYGDVEYNIVFHNKSENGNPITEFNLNIRPVSRNYGTVELDDALFYHRPENDNPVREFKSNRRTSLKYHLAHGKDALPLLIILKGMFTE